MGSANWYKIDNVAKIFLATVSKEIPGLSGSAAH